MARAFDPMKGKATLLPPVLLVSQMVSMQQLAIMHILVVCSSRSCVMCCVSCFLFFACIAGNI